MSRPSSKKKEALRLYNKFKQTYEKIEVRNKLLMLNDTVLDNFWQENRPSDKEVAEEIVKLVGEDTIEMKIILANVRFGDFNIPQKKWFLGSIDSIALQPRQPCNMYGYYCSTLQFGQLKETCFIHLFQLLPFLTCPRKIRILNGAVSIRVEIIKGVDVYVEISGSHCVIQTAPNGFFNKEQRKKFKHYQERTQFDYHGTKISLVDGKLVSKKPIFVYVGDDKTTQKILQWDLKNGGSEFYILFETYFMASGRIQETKNGLMFKSHEVRGTYGTGKFAINPAFDYLVRETAINKQPVSTSNLYRKIDLNDLKTVIDMIENKELQKQKKQEISRRELVLLDYLCINTIVLLEMKRNFNYQVATEMYLTQFELFVYNYHQSKTVTKDTRLDECSHKEIPCFVMKELIEKCRIWMKEKKQDPILKEFLFMAKNILELYCIGVVCNKEHLVPTVVDAIDKRMSSKDPDRYFLHPCEYFTPGLILLDRPIDELGFCIECLNHQIASPWFSKFHKLGRTMAVTLEKRPDMILFADVKLNLPIQLIRSFAKWYQEEHYNKINSKDGNEAQRTHSVARMLPIKLTGQFGNVPIVQNAANKTTSSSGIV